MVESADIHTLSRIAASWLREADALIITAGAGIGVDSGLPDFRGNDGFWKAYPALGQRRMSFVEAANPRSFAVDPSLAWGFYGHRLELYRHTVPHEGFAILQSISSKYANGSFVFTSNVDGQFQKAGFDPGRIIECHGSIHHLQCCEACDGAIWPADSWIPQIDVEACQLKCAPPRCNSCGGLARPNILMFGDGSWIESRTDEQFRRYESWRTEVTNPVVIELGAGTAIPSVRHFGENAARRLIRINPTPERHRAGRTLHLQTGALAGVRAIASAL